MSERSSSQNPKGGISRVWSDLKSVLVARTARTKQVATGPRAVDPLTLDAPASAPAAARYVSCRHIERSLAFWGRSVTPCCGNTHTGLMPTIISPFVGDITADDIVKGRARIIDRHKAGDIVPECQGCARLEEQEWGEKILGPYLVDEVASAHFTSCQIRCNYCYTVTEPEMTAPLSKAPRILRTFEQLISENLLAPNAIVRFSGGEPTISPEFEPLLTLLVNHGVRCVVYTNAIKRSDAIMHALRQDKVELVLGIDAASVAVYKAIKKMNYNETVWKNVADYCAARLPNAVNKVWAKFIFCIENFHEAAQFVQRAAEAGATHVYYDFDASRKDPRNLRAGIGLPEEIAKYAALLRHECIKRGIVVEFMQGGEGWLTPERNERMEQELQRLNVEFAAAT
jgi:organic radical activating enzyme